MPPPYAIRVRTATGWQDIAIQGAQGVPGQGVPAGGAVGQALIKTGAPDYSTGWGIAGAPPEVLVGPNPPTGTEVLWIDTDDPLGQGPPPLVTSLPAGAVEGQEIYLDANPGQGVIWHLRYDATINDSSKWEFIGGPPITGEDDTNFTTASTTHVAQPGPSVTIPVAGVYDIWLNGLMSSANVATNAAIMSIAGGGLGGNDTYAAYVGTGAAVAVSGTGHMVRRAALTTGSLVPSLRSSSAGAGTVGCQRRRVSLTPVRLG